MARGFNLSSLFFNHTEDVLIIDSNFKLFIHILICQILRDANFHIEYVASSHLCIVIIICIGFTAVVVLCGIYTTSSCTSV